MNFNFNDEEAERQKTLKFAEDNNISDNELNAVYDKIYNELPDNLSDKAKTLRALRKTRGSLRKIANSNANYVDCFLFMRFRDNDFNVNAWNKVDKYVKENGVEAATQQGMINDEGDYVHTGFTTQFTDQMGKVIDKKDARGSALGLLKTGADDAIEVRFLSIGKFNVWEKIPICREISMNIKEATAPGKLFTDKNQLFVNGVRYTNESHYYTNEAFQSYINIIEQNCGDIFFSIKSDIDDYAQKHQKELNFVAAYSIVNRIGNVLDDGAVPIELELDDGVITVWATKNVFKDLLIEEGIAGVAFLETYVNKEGNVGYRIGGFLPLSED